MKTNHSSVKVEKIITVTTESGKKIYFDEETIDEINEFLLLDTIPNTIESLKDNIISISTLKIQLEKENMFLADLYDVDPIFFLHQKMFICFLKALGKCNKKGNEE